MRTPYCIARLSWTTFKKVGANSDTIHVLDRLPTNDKPARSLRYKTSRVVRYETSAYRWNVTLAVRSRPLQCNLRYFTVRVALPTHGSPSVQKCQRLIHWQPTDSWKTDDQWSLISHCQSSMFMFFRRKRNRKPCSKISSRPAQISVQRHGLELSAAQRNETVKNSFKTVLKLFWNCFVLDSLRCADSLTQIINI